MIFGGFLLLVVTGVAWLSHPTESEPPLRDAYFFVMVLGFLAMAVGALIGK